jgi:uncharacterized repeat protein (TIGR01451 family)
VRNYTRVVVGVSLLAGAALAGWAVAQPPPGGWAPRVIATSHPVNDVEPPKPASVLPGRTGSTDLPPVVRTTPADPAPAHPMTGDALRLVGGRAAPPGACLVVERVAPAQATAGKPLAYQIVVHNVGAAEAQRVRVEEQLPAGGAVTATEPKAEARGNVLAWDIGALAAGAEARLRVTMQPPADGDLATTATVTCATTSTMQVGGARAPMSLSMTNPPPVQVGQKVIFPIRMANNTTAPLTKLWLHAKLSAGLQHSEGSQIEAPIPLLGPGEVKTVPLELIAAKAGRWGMTATLTGPGGESQTAEASVELRVAAASPAPVPPAVIRSPEVKRAPPTAPAVAPPGTPPALPDLPMPPQTMDITPRRAQRVLASAGGPAVRLDLADADPAVEVGRETTYEIRVSNQGAAPTRDVLVQAMLPDELALVRADGPGGQPAQVRGQQVAFGPLPSLDGQGQAVYRLRVKALRPGEARVTAHLRCGDMSRPLSREVSTRVYSDELLGGVPMQR